MPPLWERKRIRVSQRNHNLYHFWNGVSLMMIRICYWHCDILSTRHMTQNISNWIRCRWRWVSFLLKLQHRKDRRGTLICNKKYRLFALKNAIINFFKCVSQISCWLNVATPPFLSYINLYWINIRAFLISNRKSFSLIRTGLLDNINT